MVTRKGTGGSWDPLADEEDTLVLQSDGPVTFVCGECGAPLLKNVSAGQVRGGTFGCARCGAQNAGPE